MPYISPDNQKEFDALIKEIGKADIKTAGELNFLFTKLAIQYVATNGLRYQNMNDVVGSLEGAKQEFYRRVVAPYENQKAYEVGQQNADPFDALQGYGRP